MDIGETIEHKGVVTAIGRGTVKVRIVDAEGDCQGCAIASFCRQAVEVDASIADASRAKVGSEVVVSAQASIQRRALAMLAGVPLALLVAALGLSRWLGASELSAGLISIGAVALWYSVLYFSRLKINKTIHYKVSDVRS